MSEDNKTLILREFEELKGQFVISSSQHIERLVAIGEDDSDYYWVTYDGRKLKWGSCVGRLMPLKGYLRNKDYDELVRLAKINHYDQPTLWGSIGEEAAEKHREFQLLNLGPTDKLLTEVCWEIV